MQDGPFAWDEMLQSTILGSFFYGYVCTQLPGGMLSPRIGTKKVLGAGILVTSIFTILSPLAAKLGPYYLIACRVIEG